MWIVKKLGGRIRVELGDVMRRLDLHLAVIGTGRRQRKKRRHLSNLYGEWSHRLGLNLCYLSAQTGMALGQRLFRLNRGTGFVWIPNLRLSVNLKHGKISEWAFAAEGILQNLPSPKSLVCNGVSDRTSNVDVMSISRSSAN